MKIAFDEHVPKQMVLAFKALGLEKRFKDFEFVSAKDYAPKPTDPDYVRKRDDPWLKRFSDQGGTVVISGDVSMMDRPAEMQALRDLGFWVFLFERKWNQWDFYQKSALLLFYWERIARKIKKGKRGKFWRIPNHFKTDDELQDVTPGNKKIKKANPHAARRKVQARSKVDESGVDVGGVLPRRLKSRKGQSAPADERQGALTLSGGGPRARISDPEE